MDWVRDWIEFVGILKLKLCADRVALGPEVRPIPIKGTDCGLPPVSSVMDIDALRGPRAPGANLISMVQFAPGARDDPQVVLLRTNSSALVPVIAMLAMLISDAPLL